MNPALVRRRRAWVAVAGATLLGACSSDYPPPPTTRRAPVTDTIHGVAIADQYRWLEDQESAETRAWIVAQNAYADSVIGRTPLRAELEARLRALMDVPDVGNPVRRGGYEFFTLRRTGEELAAIYRRPAPQAEAAGPIDPTGTHERLIDPAALSPDYTTSVAIQSVSPDGRRLIYSVRDGGPDEIELRVFDVARRADLPDRLPPALYASVAFNQAGTGFYYTHRSRQTGPRVYFHRLGAPVGGDRLVYGEGIAPTAFINVSEAANGRYLMFTVQHGWTRTDVEVLDRRSGRLITVARDQPARFAAQFLEGELYLRTNLDAPKNRLFAVNLDRPAREHWREVIPEGEEVMDDVALIEGKLYVTYIRDVSTRIRVFRLDGTLVGEVPIPSFHGASIRGGPRGSALLSIASYHTPPVVFRLDLATLERELWEDRGVPFDAGDIEVRQVWYRSRDGTEAPMYLMHRRGLSLTGEHPTLLHGYGGFNVSLLPRFEPRAAVWVERGGVFAVATLRGGGEYGESWHRAGQLENKQNVFDDFLAAAEWLVNNGYTRPERLAIWGSSNGGLLVGAALTQHPDVFRAVVCGFPDLDMVRFYTFTETNNLPALLEYGNAAIREQFEFLRAYSPYQRVRDGTRYPAVMLTSGDLDTRVPPLQARKMTARLQAATRSGRPVILHYDPRAGHAGGRPLSEVIRDTARELAFLLGQVGAEGAAR